MANIRVKCPACKSELEIDESHEGQEIECGNCLEVFTAKRGSGSASEGDTPSKSGGGSSSRGKRKSDEVPENKPKRKKRRRDDDDDDYDHDRRRDDDDDDYPGPPRRRPSNTNGLAIASLITGILSVLPLPLAACCGCIGIIVMPVSGLLALGAIITGALALRQPEGKPMAIIGMVLGGLAIVFIVLLLILGLVMMVPNQPPPARR